MLAKPLFTPKELKQLFTPEDQEQYINEVTQKIHQPLPDITQILPDIIVKFLNQPKNNATIASFIHEVSRVHYADKQWGNEQYSGSYATFKTLTILSDFGLDPTKLIGLPKLTELVKNKATLKNSAAYAVKIVSKYIEISHAKYPTTKNVDDLVHSNSLDPILKLMSKIGWNLWDTMDLLQKYILGNDFSRNKQKLLYGSYKTGLECYLLYYIGYVKNPEVYQGFST